MNLKGRSFLTLKDFTPEEIIGLLDLAADLKAKKKQHGKNPIQKFNNCIMKEIKILHT